MQRFLFAMLAMLTTFTCCASAHAQMSPAGQLFREVIAPAFSEHCVSCHNEADRKGGLSLQTRKSAIAGGESGQVIYPGDPDSSYLLDLITPHEDNGGASSAEMPKGAAPLDERTRAAIRKWIAAGAPWPEDVTLQQSQWWSLTPLSQPTLPQVDGSLAAWARTPIDLFIAAELQENDLQPAEQANRRTLIRRLSFDLLGLPPTLDQIEAFVSDADPLAYEKLVDRMLASPRYGERWARHWLDVVHYGETHGYDKDKPRPNAWPYRDYVIRSFNQDKPYAQFVQEQLAGDVLLPGSRDGSEALGFIAAGPWDFIGHVELPESKIDGQIARHLDRDDMVQNTMMSFLSVTAGCAQCHDHKFDPITQREYYQLQAVFAALDRTNLSYDSDPQIAARRSFLKQEQDRLAKSINDIDAEIARIGGKQWEEINAHIARLETAGTDRPEQFGYHSAIERNADNVKWVQVDLGSAMLIDRVEVVPCHDDFNNIGAGFGFPQHYKIEACNDVNFAHGVQVIIDRTSADVPNPGTRPQSASAGQIARYVRFTATKLARRQNDYILALAELRVFDADGKNRASGKAVTALDSIEAPIRWSKANLVDGLDPNRSHSAKQLAELKRSRERLYRQLTSAEMRGELASLERQNAEVDRRLSDLPPMDHVYAGAIHHGSGNFSGTGSLDGQPRKIHFLNRGDVNSPGDELVPGALSCLDALDAGLELSLDSTDGERRAALARWITSNDNPLVWRSIVNRVWQYHFGQGIVTTPNDFGRMGERPSHPELLDWLAATFRDNGGSLKDLHRMIVTSSVYRQRSSASPEQQTLAARIDPSNRLLWRMNRRRLEAEAIHDSVLQLASKLNTQMGGPSYEDFVIEKPEHSPHYRYDLHDPNNPASHRRAVYRMIVRSQTQPMLTALDCADPSMQVGNRNESNTPLQALTMLNNNFTLAMAGHFAERVRATHHEPGQQILYAFTLATGRQPNAAEANALKQYAREHGLKNACRLILNLNECLYVD